MIEVKNLVKRYGDNLAVDNISFSIPQGGIYGFLGPNGAGKSTTMNIMTGCLAATSGEITIDGHDIFDEPTEAKKSIGYLPEQPPLYVDMTPQEYLTFVAEAKKVKKADIPQQVASAMERTGLSHMKNRLIRNLSKGYRQRVGVAQAIIGNPKLIILDEPTVGLDPVQILEIRDLIRSLGKEHTVILSSHILQEVSAVCDHIIMISNGKLVASEKTEDLTALLTRGSVLDIEVIGSEAQLRKAVEGIEGVDSVKTKTTGSETVSISIEYSRDIDLREKVSRAITGSGMVIMGMTLTSASLEDVFVELTTQTGVKEDRKGAAK